MSSALDSSRFSTSRFSGSRFGGAGAPVITGPADMVGEASSVFVRTSRDADGDGAYVDLMRRSSAYLRLDIPPETITGAGTNSIILEVPDAPV